MVFVIMLSFIIQNFAVFIIEQELKFLLSSFLSRTKISFRLSRWFGRKTLCFILFYSPGLAVFHSFLDFQISSYLMIHQQYLIIRLDISLSSLDYQINSYLMIHQQYLIIWLDISLSSLDYQINSYLIHHLYLIIWLDISLSFLDYQINSYLIHHLYLIIRSIQFQ